MKIKLTGFKRSAYVAVALLLATVGVLADVRLASAAPLSSRSIRMGRSAASATNVIYRVAFTIPASVNTGSVVVDFCSNSPLIGETCTGVAVNPGFATLSINNQTGAAFTDLSVDTTNSDNNTVILPRSGASSVSGTVIFELGNGTTNGFTNPAAVGTFYARIYTYASTTPTHNEDAATGYVDTGGIALSTAAVINITARVQETLSFCVYPDDDGGGPGSGTCGDTPTITIGHDNGAGTFIIDSTQVDTALVNFSLSTNANGGAVVRMKGDTLKDSVTPTPNDINAKGAASTFAAGEEGFGLRISTAGSMTAVAPYNGAANNYGLVVTGGGTDDVTSTFGGSIASSAGPVNASVTTITFAAQASNTTAAGVYTASEQLIATGTF